MRVVPPKGLRGRRRVSFGLLAREELRHVAQVGKGPLGTELCGFESLSIHWAPLFHLCIC